VGARMRARSVKHRDTRGARGVSAVQRKPKLRG